MLSFINKLFFVLLISLLLSNANACGQNLVNNPGFENYSNCPVFPGEVYKCNSWSTYGHTPDYFNSCTSDTIVDVPINNLGYQNALSGNAYCGFLNFLFTQPFREYIGTNLIQPLIIGQKYFISFSVSLADKFPYNCPSNKVGARFSTIAYDSLNLPPLNNIAHVYTDSLINNTVGWFQVRGSFIADSNYSYLAIGNFFTDSATSNNCNNFSYASYLFIENVCVSIDSNTCYSLSNTNTVLPESNISVFPNPVNDYLNISLDHSEILLEIEIFSLEGRLIFHKRIFDWEIRLQLGNLETGIYFFRLITKNRIFLKKFVKS